MSEVFYVMELIGTIAFAMSGAFVAIEQKMDILGVIILGITTSIGGGIIRDILIGIVPPSGLVNPVYSVIAIIVSVIVFIPKNRKHINLDSKFFVFVDAVGLGVFTVSGCIKALPFDNILFQLFLGVLTGVGGGVLRDVFAAQKPMIFVRHFYALASLIGAAVFMVLQNQNQVIAMIAGVVTITVLRMLAATYKWHLPKA
ncbi:MAG: TRIC cation channel family protein [Clostridia bacterium]|nr:TRIC cation channel family protein [Clostridia bacterium]